MANWQGVSEFVAVAQSNSFTQGAQKLDCSVVQVSRRVSNLEAHLGVKLLNRTTRKVSLTDAGELYYQQCKALVVGLEQAELAVTQMQQQPKGLLKVTAPVTYGENIVAPLVNQFLALYPQVDVELVLTNQQLDLIDSGIDVAIRLGQLTDSSLIGKKLGSRQLFVCASKAYLNRCGTPQTLNDLTEHQCLVGSLDFWRFKDKNRKRSLRVNGRFKCNSGLALLDGAKQGLGLVQLPDYYVNQALNSGELVEVLSSYRVAREGIWALFNQNLSPKVRYFVDFVAEKLTEPNNTRVI